MTIPRRIADFLDDYLDGRIVEDDAVSLTLWVNESASRQDMVSDWFVREAELRQNSRIAYLCNDLKANGLLDLSTTRVWNERSDSRSNGGPLKFWLRSRRYVLVGAGLAAALLVAASVPFLSDYLPQPIATLGEKTAEPIAVTDEDVRVATLGRLAGCEWAEGSPHLDSGQGIEAGATLQLTKGLASIVFESGAEVIVQGPTKLRVDGPQLCGLVLGSIAANVPPRASGVTVRGPASEVIDLGTQFGFSVSDDGSSEVHVFKGEVVTRSLDSSGNAVGDRLLLKQNEAVHYPHTVEEAKRLAADEAKFVRSIPTMWAPGDIEPLPIDSAPSLWLRAAHGIELDDSGGVFAWHDLSPEGLNASTDAFQSQEDFRPRLISSAISGRPAVRFDGANDYLTTTTMATTDNQTIVVVFQNVRQPQSEPGQIINYNGPPSRVPDLARAGVLQLGENVGAAVPPTSVSAKAYAGRNNQGQELDSGLVTSSALDFQKPCVAVYVYDYTNQLANLYIDGKLVDSSMAWAPVAVTSRKVIGKHGIFEIRFFSGDVAEVQIFDTALSSSAVSLLSEYLMNHYGF
jgi:hypothetical protein